MLTALLHSRQPLLSNAALRYALTSAALICAALVTPSLAWCQEEDDEQPFLPGLVAQYQSGDEQCVRLDDAIAFDWASGAPDERIRPARFTASWRGRLLTQAAGEYRLYAYVQGRIAVRLDGKQILTGESTEPRWFSSAALNLVFDHHPLEIDYAKTGAAARMSLFWSGPQFQLEPISPRQLFHDRGKTPDVAFERGQLLAAALRCTNCHREDAALPSPTAPALDKLAGNISRPWLQAWIENPAHQASGVNQPSDDSEAPATITRMPAFGLSVADADAIASYLLHNSLPSKVAIPAASPNDAPKKPAAKQSQKKGQPKVAPPSAKQGERLFLTLGCLACHQLGDLGESGLFGGGDLTRIAQKRPADYFAKWLAEPAALNAQHRMPVFDLTAHERQSLALFLQGSEPIPASDKAPISDRPESIARGSELIASYGCAACHQLPGKFKPRTSPAPLTANSNWNSACSSEPLAIKHKPGYRLPKEDAAAIQAYFSASRPQGVEQEPRIKAIDGRQLLVEQNCLACHQREGLGSLASALPARLQDKLAAVAEAHEGLTTLVPAMTPPALNSVGDKLLDEVLVASIRRQGAVHRPYLLVRMPKFHLSDVETAALVRYFTSTDRIPPLPAEIASPPVPPAAAHSLAGGRLVSSDGFSCTSCHAVGSVQPDKAPLNARGPTLSGMDKRLRKEWFDRWVRNPARIVPRMEMPSVQIPVRGVLGEKLDDQLAAVWNVLNTPGFEPPEPNPVRVLRLSGVQERNEKPIVINDVVKLGDKTWTNPLVIGLSNRHNVLIDLETNRLAGWWLGDTARQRTKGKSWHWEPGGAFIPLDASSGMDPIILVQEKELEIPAVGQFAREPQRVSIRQNAVTISRAFRSSPAAKAAAGSVLYYDESFQPLFADNVTSGGFQRNLLFGGLPPDSSIRLRLVQQSLAEKSRWDATAKVLHLPGAGNPTIQVEATGDMKWEADGSLRVAAPLRDAFASEQHVLEIKLQYRSRLSGDLYLADPPPIIAVEATEVEIAPGWHATRLPLPDDIMPTGFAWQNNRLLFASLKGQVYAAVDADSDGLEDTSHVLMDGLATPYGIASHGHQVDVIVKGGLLRLGDFDSAGRANSWSRIASGWGHTDDYHDWAVGLVKGENGEYYIGLPCQQDDRSAAAARHRGQMLKLVPRKPTKDDPRLYAIETVSSGHRFPMGLALNRAGDLFVTDNQGNYNPFNELNHVRPGAHFGFINKLQKTQGYKPPRYDAPAIDIPHPWTRSVNGICFLDTPEALRKEKGEVFGPLEGHLIGCEYDTRRLVRMTLEKVGGEYQGAAYPLSMEPSSPDKGLLGPIVCAVSPRGELYVGNIRDSGWGAGNNIGEIVQMKVDPAQLSCGIGEVRVAKEGFTIDFLQPVDLKLAADVASYSLASYRRESTPAYGGPDLDRRIEKISQVQVSSDSRRVTLHLPELREGFVYELQLKNLAPQGGEFYPAEAHYTLRKKR